MNGILKDFTVAVTRRLEEKGRLLIPETLREATGITGGCEVEITVATLESAGGRKPVFIISKKEG